MNTYGFARVANGTPLLRLGDTDYNTEQIKSLYEKADHENVDLLITPELSITGYSMADLFHQEALLDSAYTKLIELKRYSQCRRSSLIVGLPLLLQDSVYNMAAVISSGKILGLVPKTYLPTYNEFYETRWFASAHQLTLDQCIIDGETVPVGSQLIFETDEKPKLSFAVEICEDLWSPLPPSTFTAMQGALVIANISASNELISKSDYRRSLISNQSARLYATYMYCSSGWGESTTDVTYGGDSMIAESGSLIAQGERFSLNEQLVLADIDLNRLRFDRLHSNTYRETKAYYSPLHPVRHISYHLSPVQRQLKRFVNPYPFVPADPKTRQERCEEIFNIQTHGLAKRLSHIGEPTALIGISGGLDSTLALLVAVKTFDLLGRDRKGIIGITMPGFGTTDRTYNNALDLMNTLGITQLEIPIRDAVTQHFSDINHSIDQHDITYENSQARERTQILMDAANKYKGIVIGTGDLSELALGWATYNGDHMSMYGVNVSIPKTLVRYLVEWVALNSLAPRAKEILMDILATPVSPELLPPSSDGKIAQKTEEVVGPYELHDFFLYHLLRYGESPNKIFYLSQVAFQDKYDKATLLRWLETFYKRFFSQQFKRSALPDGPKVGSICLSPRGDLRMPSDSTARLWLRQISDLKSL